MWQQTVGLWSAIICEGPRWLCGSISFQRSTVPTISTSAFTFSTTSTTSTVSTPTVSTCRGSTSCDEPTPLRPRCRRPTRRLPLHAKATPSPVVDRRRRLSRRHCRRDGLDGGGGDAGAGDTDSNSSLSVALCPSKIGDDNDAHLYRTHLQQPASHRHQRSGVHNDVHLTTLPHSSAGCCRRGDSCRVDTLTAGDRRAAPTILKDVGRRQQSHGVQSPPPPPPPTSQSPAAVSVVISNHTHPLQCFDDNPSTTV